MKIKGLYKRGNVFWFRKMVDGKRTCQSLNTSNLDAAISKAAELVRLGPKKGDGLISTMRKKWIAAKRADGKFKPKTAIWADSAINRFQDAVGDIPVSVITEDKIKGWQRKIGETMSKAGAASYMRCMKAFFKWLESERYIVLSPCSGVKMPRIGKYNARRNFCTKKQRDDLIKNAPTDDLGFILRCGFFLGLRKNEIIEARRDWFDLEAGCLYVTKSTGARLRPGEKPFETKDSDDRTIPIKSDAIPFFRAYMKDRSPLDFVLCPGAKHGKALYRYDFRRPFTDYMKAQKKEWVTAHAMRRTFASLLVQSGVSIYKVARWLGDGVDVVVNHYGHLTPGDKDIEKLG